MKPPLLLLLLIAALTATAQQSDSTYIYDFGGRIYNTRPCGFCPLKPGEPIPENHPNAKYMNDPDLWEWREVDMGLYGIQKIYDLKPQYKDTLILHDGTVKEVPAWLKDPNWKKPVAL